jgi:hypothetical protein
VGAKHVDDIQLQHDCEPKLYSRQLTVFVGVSNQLYDLLHPKHPKLGLARPNIEALTYGYG